MVGVRPVEQANLADQVVLSDQKCEARSADPQVEEFGHSTATDLILATQQLLDLLVHLDRLHYALLLSVKSHEHNCSSLSDDEKFHHLVALLSRPRNYFADALTLQQVIDFLAVAAVLSVPQDVRVMSDD